MTHLWIPRGRLLEPNRELDLPTGLAGYWKLAVRRPDGRTRLETSWFPNLITDAGLNAIGTGDYMQQVRVGSGNATPSVLDAGLQSQVAVQTSPLASATAGAQSSAPYYGFTNKTWRFGQGAAAGNLAEIGIGRTSGGVLFSRALILDDVGVATTITVLSDEFLDATYSLRGYPPLDDSVGTVVIGGTTHNFTLRASVVTQGNHWAPGGGLGSGAGAGMWFFSVFNGAIGAITASPSGSGGGGSVSQAAYSNNSLQRDATVSFGLSEANLSGGIRSLQFGCGMNSGGLGTFQAELSPTIPKTSSDLLTLSARHSWARRTL